MLDAPMANLLPEDQDEQLPQPKAIEVALIAKVSIERLLRT